MDILPKKRQTRSQGAAAPARTVKALPRPKISKTRHKNLRRRLLVVGIAIVNVVVIGFTTMAVLVHSEPKAVSYGIGPVNETIERSNPLDAMTAADIAANIAQLTGLPEELAVTNQADTISLYLSDPVIEKDYVTKTQILGASIKSKADIIQHAVADGEKLGDLAAKYGVTSDSIRWSNNLTGDRLTVGQTLFVPPINGFVHTVGVGDTPEKLAQSYSAKVNEIIAFNDAEITGLVLGDRIVVPNGVKQETRRAIMSFKANYGYNGYWYGYCTWYVATKITVPNNWGNANTWDNRARLTPGWTVSATPIAGAIAQSNSGPEGHVAIVEAVSEDGTMMKYSDMNGLAGWGKAGTSAWVPIHQSFQNFIYRTQ